MTGSLPSHLIYDKKTEPNVRKSWKESLPDIPYEDSHKLLGLDTTHQVLLHPMANGLGISTWDHPLIKHDVTFQPGYGGSGPSAYINSLQIKSGNRGKGLGADVFARQAKFLSDSGFDNIKLLAARGLGGGVRYNGYMVWPKFGFDAHVDEMIDPELRNKFKKHWPNVSTLQQLVALPGGWEWWEKHGKTTPMRFDTKPGSVSMGLISSYLRNKGMDNSPLFRPVVRTKLIHPTLTSPNQTSFSSNNFTPSGGQLEPTKNRESELLTKLKALIAKLPR